MFSPAEGEEHSRIAQIFSQEAEQEMTAALKPTEEEEADNMDFVDLCEELESLERRVIVQSQHIQQIRLETDGAYQPKEQLEEAGDMPAGELTVKLSEEEAEQQLSDETAELKSAAGWQAKATRDGENHKGDQVDLPINEEGVQWSRLHKESQPLEQLDREIEEIKRLMLRSARTASKEKLNRREPAIAAGKKQQQRQKVEQMDSSKEQFGIQVDFNRAGKLMSRSS
jgi:hypothetical protein